MRTKMISNPNTAAMYQNKVSAPKPEVAKSEILAAKRLANIGAVVAKKPSGKKGKEAPMDSPNDSASEGEMIPKETHEDGMKMKKTLVSKKKK